MGSNRQALLIRDNAPQGALTSNTMNHEKIEAIKQITLAAVAIAIIVGLLHYLNAPERKRLAQVQSGELVLECNMRKTGVDDNCT